VAHKVGVFGYNRAASVEEIRNGRGLSNTAIMIQAPHDGAAGTTPWVAGGGATLRGVPEKNSIQPFVLSNDRNGKPIQHAGKRGTNVLMADGTVRWIASDVSDDVFKAMVTLKGPAPEGLDSLVNEWAPVIADTAKREKVEIPPAKVSPPPQKKDATKKAAPKPATPPAKVPAQTANEMVINAVALVKEYQANRDLADKKYKGKTIVVVGKVLEIDEQSLTLETGLPSILPGAGDGATDIVDCSFRNALAGISPGMTVRVRGRCDGFNEILDVDLSNCVIVK
jgi:hypothetical protein